VFGHDAIAHPHHPHAHNGLGRAALWPRLIAERAAAGNARSSGLSFARGLRATPETVSVLILSEQERSLREPIKYA
jgi:hypothetical protein